MEGHLYTVHGQNRELGVIICFFTAILPSFRRQALILQHSWSGQEEGQVGGKDF
jgi:hypothetical protein